MPKVYHNLLLLCEILVNAFMEFPLINREVKQRVAQLKLDTNETPMEQLQTRVGDWHQRLIQREREIEATPFWRDLSPVLAIVSGIFFVGVSGLLAATKFASLQRLIPFYYLAAEQRWTQADKTILLIVPISAAIANFVLINLIYQIFIFDRRLSRVLSWLLAVVNVMSMLAITQMYSLFSSLP